MQYVQQLLLDKTKSKSVKKNTKQKCNVSYIDQLHLYILKLIVSLVIIFAGTTWSHIEKTRI